MKTVTVLGSTGSIGVSTVKVLAEHRDKFKVNALVANSNAALLAEQAKMLDAGMAVVVDELKYPTLRGSMFGTDTLVASGRKGVSEAIAMDSDITVLAISGAAGLSPAMEVIKRGKVLALANKETLVCAGSLVMKSAKLHGCTILPVDSEQ
jgi:1-deoxy-D-xylulose-5-phosphate reductoisomerase